MHFSKHAVHDVPFANAYWAIPGRLLAGDCPLAGDIGSSIGRLSALIDHGIRHIVDLTEPGEIFLFDNGPQKYGGLLDRVAGDRGVEVTYHSMPVKDFAAPMRKQMAAILDDIDRALEAERPVYVHCRAGIGRTGTVVGCFLARHGHGEGDALLDLIRKLRRRTGYAFIDSPQSREQIDLVLSWVASE